MQWRTVHGEQIPTIGLGTYELDGGECANTVRDALEIGYRHIDTAEHYDNQSEIGNAIANSSVDREELFLTTKVWKTNLEYEDVIRSTRASLEALDVDYVDLLLIHWPNERIPIEETLAAMNSLQDEGAVRHVGVSNFSIAQLRKAIATSETPILTNQVQYNPFTDRTDILEFCVKHDVLMTAYSPLAKGRVTKNDVLKEISNRYEKSPAQVTLRWLVQQEQVIAIPKASNRQHLRSNFDVFDFELVDEEIDRISELEDDHRPILSRFRTILGL